MKKLLSLLLVLTLVLSLLACSKYEPVMSTDEEREVIMTLSLDGEEYQVRYELYRALFLNYKSVVDGGDASVWTGSAKDEYIKKINELIVDYAAEIFSAIHLCETVVGYDLYSSDADDRVEAMVVESIEGGDGTMGHGTYEAYLAFLKAQNLKYSVQDLIFRYYLALAKIDEYFVGDTESDGVTDGDAALPALPVSLQTVREFYYSDNCARAFYSYFALTTQKNLSIFRDKLASAAKNGKAAVLEVAKPESIWDEIFLAKHAYNDEFNDIKERIFSLPAGEVSEVIKVDSTGDATIDGYYVLYSIEKNEDDFINNYSDIKLAYLSEKMGSELASRKATLKSAVSYKDAYGTLVHSNIAM